MALRWFGGCGHQRVGVRARGPLALGPTSSLARGGTQSSTLETADRVSGLSWTSGGCWRPVGFWSLSYPGRKEQMRSVNRSLQTRSLEQQRQHHLGTYRKSKFLGPNSDLPYQKLGGGGRRCRALLAGRWHVPLSEKRTPGSSGLLPT